MLTQLGKRFTDLFIKYMPSAYVFALILTLITGVSALILTNSGLLDIISGWYGGFWDLLAFGMQIVLIVITAYCIAQSPLISKGIDALSKRISHPTQVYILVVFIGTLLSFISFGMVVITAILGRELAERVKGIHYPFLVACVYFSFNGWVCGLSSSIALLLNTEDNFLIKNSILESTISTELTLGSPLNLAMMVVFLLFTPILLYVLKPKTSEAKTLDDLKTTSQESQLSIKDEAKQQKLPFKAVSDYLNNLGALQIAVASLGLLYIIHHFYTKGFDLNFNIMIFIFLITGMFLHLTPMRYSIAMKRASSNISGILFQYPFYAGIMGIMISSGLGTQITELLSSFATSNSYAAIAYLTGGFINFAIPSAGGEFAVIGPSIISMVQDLSIGLSDIDSAAMIARASMSMAYGESLSNLLQPFFLLVIFPVMAAGVKLQARDVMGYLVMPFIVMLILQLALVSFIPL